MSRLRISKLMEVGSVEEVNKLLEDPANSLYERYNSKDGIRFILARVARHPLFPEDELGTESDQPSQVRREMSLSSPQEYHNQQPKYQ